VNERSGNIYGSGTPTKRPDLTTGPAGASQMDVFVQELLQRQRRQAVALLVVTALAVVLVLGMVYYWMSRSKPSPYQTQERPEAELARAAAMPFEEALPLYLIDPLKHIRPLPLPDKPADLTVEWVKQAVYHLLEGEKAAQAGGAAVALSELDKVRQIFPNIKGLHRLQGLVYLQQQNYAAAAQAFEQSLREEAASFGVVNNLGIAYLGLTNMAKAEMCLQQAIRMDTNYALAYFNLAMIRQRAGDLPKAAEYLGSYARMRPEDIAATESYALMLIQLQAWAQAAEVLGSLSDALPQSSVIQFRLAQVLSHVEGRRAQALDVLEHAVKLVDSRKALGWLSRTEFDLLRKEPRFKTLSDTLAKGRE
jgi:tetratricopeptide (TPR) repeat protein